MTDNETPRKERDWIPNRTHALLLCLIALVGLARGTYWVVTTEVWNPIDEAQHYSYIESLARGHGMPIVGEDQISLDVKGFAKESPTLPFQSQGYIVSDDFDWGVFGNSYEGGGVQGPAYYALLTPVYWIADPFGITATIFTLRLASIIVTLSSIPLLWLLGKRLFPDHAVIWLGAPAFLVLIQGFNANSASINNDALLIPVCIAAMIPVADALRGLQMRQAAVAGALFGLALLTKPTTPPLAVYTGLVLVWLLLTRRETLPDLIRWGVVYSAVTIAVMVPYIVWNFATYGSYSASEEVNEITGFIQDDLPVSWHSLKVHLKNSLTGFWDLQPRSLTIYSTYFKVIQFGTMAAMGLGILVSAARRKATEAAILVLLALAFPIAFGMKLAINYLLVDGVGTVFGRHVYPALGLVALGVPAGLVIAFGRKLGLIALAAFFALILIAEREVSLHYVDSTYTSSGLTPAVAPVIDQPLQEARTFMPTVIFDSPCRAEHIAIAFANSPPSTLSVTHESGTQQAVYLANFNTVLAVYGLPEPLTGQIRVALNAVVAYSESNDDPAVSAPDGPGDPVSAVYCPVDDPAGFRYEQTYPPGHPDIGYSALRAWPTVWYWIGWVMLAGSVAAAAYIGYDNLQRRRTAT